MWQLLAVALLARGAAASLGSHDRYIDAGPGLCCYNGHAPVGQFLASVDVERCERLCEDDAQCWGYSHDPDAHACSLFDQGPLAGGGPAWGSARCATKMPRGEHTMSAKPTVLREAISDPQTVTTYEVDGTGACTVGGIPPFSKTYHKVSKRSCAETCTAAPDCYGYTTTAVGGCRTLTQGPLKGGCHRKVQVPAASASELYHDAGAGTCRWRGKTGQVRLLPGLSASECAVRCTLVPACTGFASQADQCVLHTGATVRGGGEAWGRARCRAKVSSMGDDYIP